MEDNCYVLDVGVLLKPDDEQFEHYNVYDGKYGYYDEDLSYYRDLEAAKKAALNYVKDGVDQTYAVITSTYLSEDIDVTDDDVFVEDENYDINDVVYCVMKNGDEIKEDFIEVPQAQ